MKKFWTWFKDGHGMWLIFAVIVFGVRVRQELFHQFPIWLNIGSFLAFTLFYILYMVFGVYRRLNAIKNIKWNWMIAASVLLLIFVFAFPWGDVTVPPLKNSTAVCVGAVGLFFSLFSFCFALMEYTDPKKTDKNAKTPVDLNGVGL